MHFDHLYLFVQIVEHGSISEAARNLQLPKSKLSRYLSQLEADLRLKLLQRSTRSLHLTEEGEQIFQQVSPLYRELEQISQWAGQARQAPHGNLKISMPPEFEAYVIANKWQRFRDLYPEVTVELDVSTEKRNLYQQQFDIAVRAGTNNLEDSNLIASHLGYVERWLVTHATEAIDANATIDFEQLGRSAGIMLAHQPHWQFQHRNKPYTVTPKRRWSCNNLISQQNAVLQGLGIAALPRFMVEDEIANKQLVKVNTEANLVPAQYCLITKSRDFLAPKIRVMLDFLKNCFNETVKST